MRPPERWPLHPAPAETESLSSWMRRIAASYSMYSYELLEHEEPVPTTMSHFYEYYGIG